MGFSYENQGSYVYLVYSLEKGEEIDSVSLGMLTNNAIRGMAKTFFTQMNEDRFIKFNVSATVTMEQFFTGPVDRRRLLTVFRGIVDALLEADEYMIDLRSVLIDMKYIFINVSSCETTMICLPVVSENQQEVDLVSFFKNIIFSIQTNQAENCDHIARMINYLNSTPLFSPESFKSLLDELLHEGGKVASEPQNGKIWTQPINPAPAPAAGWTEVSQPAKTPVPPQPTYQENTQQPVIPPKTGSGEKPAEDSAGRKPEMQIPTKAKAGTTSPSETKGSTAEEEKSGMSAWYLLRHYTKENVELYKAQKDEKQKKQKDEQKKPMAGGGSGFDFAIPGQDTSPAPKPAPQPPQPKPQPKPQPTVAPQPPVRPPEREVQAPPQPPRQPPKPAPQPVAPRPTEQNPNRQPPVPRQPPAPPVQTMGGPSQMGQQPIQTYVREEVTYVPGGNFGETTILTSHSIGETTMLVHNPVQRVEPFLLRLRTRERIALTKNPFRIGKEYTYADYIVTDNPAVSRSHAYVINRDGAYYVVDTNSKNHTFLNGMMLRSNTEMLLSDNDKLCLADEEFEFHTR